MGEEERKGGTEEREGERERREGNTLTLSIKHIPQTLHTYTHLSAVTNPAGINLPEL